MTPTGKWEGGRGGGREDKGKGRGEKGGERKGRRKGVERGKGMEREGNDPPLLFGQIEH